MAGMNRLDCLLPKGASSLTAQQPAQAASPASWTLTTTLLGSTAELVFLKEAVYIP